MAQIRAGSALSFPGKLGLKGVFGITVPVPVHQGCCCAMEVFAGALGVLRGRGPGRVSICRLTAGSAFRARTADGEQ